MIYCRVVGWSNEKAATRLFDVLYCIVFVIVFVIVIVVEKRFQFPTEETIMTFFPEACFFRGFVNEK